MNSVHGQTQNLLFDNAGMLFSILEAMREGRWGFPGIPRAALWFQFDHFTAWLWAKLTTFLDFSFSLLSCEKQLRLVFPLPESRETAGVEDPGKLWSTHSRRFDNDCGWKPYRLDGATPDVSHKAFLPGKRSGTGWGWGNPPPGALLLLQLLPHPGYQRPHKLIPQLLCSRQTTLFISIPSTLVF